MGSASSLRSLAAGHEGPEPPSAAPEMRGAPARGSGVQQPPLPALPLSTASVTCDPLQSENITWKTLDRDHARVLNCASLRAAGWSPRRGPCGVAPPPVRHSGATSVTTSAIVASVCLCCGHPGFP